MIFQLHQQIVERRHNWEECADERKRVEAHCIAAEVKYVPFVAPQRVSSESMDMYNVATAAASRNAVASESFGAWTCGYADGLRGQKVCPWGRDAREKPAWLEGYKVAQRNGGKNGK